MNGQQLGDEIYAQIEEDYQGGVPFSQTYMGTQEAQDIYKAIGKAVVAHIQANAKADDNGNVLQIPGNWNIL